MDKRNTTNRSQSEQELVSDFSHLGVAVSANSEDVPRTTSLSAAGLAARAAYVKAADGNAANDPSKAAQIPSKIRNDQTDGSPADSRFTTSKPDTTLHVTTARPVVHETVKVQNHEIRQEVIHKDFHEYHEITRILPVIDKVVLPTRHFIKTLDGGKVEIPEPELAPGATYDNIPLLPVEDDVPIRSELPSRGSKPI